MWLGLVTIFLGLFVIWWHKKTSKPSNFPDGPARYPLVGSMLTQAFRSPWSRKPNIFWGVMEMQKSYGNIIGMYLADLPTVIFCDYEDIKVVFNMNEASGRPATAPMNRTREGWKYILETDPVLNKGRTPGVILSNGVHWREQRRYLLRNLRDFGFGKSSMENGFLEEAQKLVQFLKPKVGQPINLNRTMNVSALNALWNILVGEKMELDSPTSLKIVKLMDDFLRGGEGPAGVLTQMVPISEILLLPGIKTLSGFEELQNIMTEIRGLIKPHLVSHKKTLDPDNIRDFMDLYLTEIQNTTDSKSTMYGKKGEANLINAFVDLFLGGIETTSSTLLWAILILVHFPECQTKMVEEIKHVVGNDRLPSLEDKNELNYTNSFIHEAMRYTTFTPLSMFQQSTDEILYKGYKLPKDTFLVQSLFHVMRDPDYWSQPNTFNPDRFLQNGKFVPDDRVVPFGMGKRICLAKSLAEKEFFVFFTTLIATFSFEKVPGEELPSMEIEKVPVLGLLRSCPMFNVIMKVRGSHSH